LFLILKCRASKRKKIATTQRKPNRDDFPRTDEFTESVVEMWFSGTGNSVATHGLSTAETRTETLSLFEK
jgi:hypothetical protein